MYVSPGSGHYQRALPSPSGDHRPTVAAAAAAAAPFSGKQVFVFFGSWSVWVLRVLVERVRNCLNFNNTG